MEETMRILALFGFLVFTVVLAAAQLTVTSSTPVDGATSVPTTTTVSFTFSGPIDTTKSYGGEFGYLSNLDTITAQWYSADRRTVYLSVRLAATKVYFVCVYWAPGDGGTNIAIPQAFTFTAAPAFPGSGYQVSGTVSGGATGISASYAMVALTNSPIGNSKPDFIAGAVADAGGAFTFPGLPAGTYYPVAIKDINQDGQLDPGRGDPIAMGDPITVISAPISGINLVFQMFGPLTYKSAFDSTATIPASSIPADRVLRTVYCWDMDTTGRSTDWTFNYTSASTGKFYSAYVGTMNKRVEELPVDQAMWFKDRKPIASPGTVAAPESIIVRTENGGGRTWRSFANTGGYIFRISMTLGYLRYSQFSGMSFDTSKIYWGVEYILGTQPRPDSFAVVRTKQFVVDIVTGNTVSVTGVDERSSEGVAAGYALAQNYPNPFNPSTTIQFSIVNPEFVLLKVYDLLGREVAVLANERMDAGAHEVKFDAAGLAGGVYYYRLQAGDFVQTKEFMLLK
jgi:hypothetical protein